MKCPHANCGYEWTPRKENPKKCPNCQNPLWRSDKPKKMASSSKAEHLAVNETVEGSIPSLPANFSDARKRAEELLRQLQ